MLRFRRYRVFLLCSLIIIFLLIQVSRHSRWQPTASASFYDSANSNLAYKSNNAYSGQSHYDGAGAAGDRFQPKPEQAIRLPELKTSEEVLGGYGLPKPTETTALAKGAGVHTPGYAAHTAEPVVPSIPDRYPGRVGDPHNGFPAAPNDAPAAPTTTIHWKKSPPHFPIPKESLIALPTGKPASIPAVQARFPKESAVDKAKRESRLAKIKAEAQRAWSGYKQYGWTHDEIMPVSKEPRDPFCGWAATLVDALDSLWIMGLKEEFDDAVAAVKDIDFTTTPHRADIPVFETVIRYLGGLLAAYDVSGGHSGPYRVLLDKALELADILMGIFDTPNRMPVLYYNWKPAFASQPHRAPVSASIAELGSLSMEFTRLAQLTGEDMYYDAIARITDGLVDWQDRGTSLPGIFPERVDASGCNRTAEALKDLAASAEAEDDGADEEATDSTAATPGSLRKRDGASSAAGGAKTRSGAKSEAANHDPWFWGKSVTANGNEGNWDCIPQGLADSGYASSSFSMGGSQDSVYEYFPKEYLLLGGLEPKYRTLHEGAARAVKKYLLYRPMTEDDRDILFSAKAIAQPGSDEDLSYEYEVTHLTCFLGGMFALGGRIFGLPEDVEVGAKLTDGCVWAYGVTPTGVMPEGSTVVPCRDAGDCHWNETLWWERLDSNTAWRDEQMDDYHRRMKAWEQEMDEYNREAERREQVAEGVRKQEEALRKQERSQFEDERGTTSETKPGQATNRDDDLTDTPNRPIQKRQVDQTAVGSAAEQPMDERATMGGRTKLEAELDLNSPSSSSSYSSQGGSAQVDMADTEYPLKPVKPLTHEEYVASRIEKEHLPRGFVSINDRRYILR